MSAMHGVGVRGPWKATPMTVTHPTSCLCLYLHFSATIELSFTCYVARPSATCIRGMQALLQHRLGFSPALRAGVHTSALLRFPIGRPHSTPRLSAGGIAAAAGDGKSSAASTSERDTADVEIPWWKQWSQPKSQPTDASRGPGSSKGGRRAGKDVIAAYFNAYNARDLDTIASLMAEDVEYHDMIYAEPFVGRYGILVWPRFALEIACQVCHAVGKSAFLDSGGIEDCLSSLV